MPMGAAELTLAKLNSALGGVGGEWGSEAGPSGAALDAEVRSRARKLGNEGQTALAAELLLQAAAGVRAQLPGALLDEIEANIVPVSPNPQSLLGTLAGLRAASGPGVGTAPGAARAAQPGGKKPGLFGRLFGRG